MGKCVRPCSLPGTVSQPLVRLFIIGLPRRSYNSLPNSPSHLNSEQCCVITAPLPQLWGEGNSTNPLPVCSSLPCIGPMQVSPFSPAIGI